MTDLGPGGATAKNMACPVNGWYVAAWDHELTTFGFIYRTITGKPMALSTAPQTGARSHWPTLAGIGWHRSLGNANRHRRGPDLYHGLRYNSAGRCTSPPAQDTINPSAMVSSFPVEQRHRYIWVWPGDPMVADPALIPDMFQMDSPEWAGDGRTIDVEANWQLVLDNLTDLTHEEFVHSSTIGQDELSESDFEVTHEGRTVTVTRWMHDIDAPPFWMKNMRDKFPGFLGKVDRWQIIEF